MSDRENLKVLVITHDDNDGIVGGLVVADKYKTDTVEVVTYSHNTAEKCKLQACEKAKEFNPDIIYIIDVPYIEELEQYCESIHWLDHHVSAIENSKYKYAAGIRSISMSGCELIWMYLNNPKGTEYVQGYNELVRADEIINFERDKAPLIVKYIGDRDNWDHRLYKTAEFNAAFQRILVANNPFTTNPDKLSELLKIYNTLNFNEVIEAGTVIYDFIKQGWKLIGNKARPSAPLKIKGIESYKVGYILSSEPSSSEWFEYVKDLYDIGVVYRYNEDATAISVSIYAIDTTIDVSIIAKQNGGGGHVGAAGFTIKR